MKLADPWAGIPCHAMMLAWVLGPLGATATKTTTAAPKKG